MKKHTRIHARTHEMIDSLRLAEVLLCMRSLLTRSSDRNYLRIFGFCIYSWVYACVGVSIDADRTLAYAKIRINANVIPSSRWREDFFFQAQKLKFITQYGGGLKNPGMNTKAVIIIMKMCTVALNAYTIAVKKRKHKARISQATHGTASHGIRRTFGIWFSNRATALLATDNTWARRSMRQLHLLRWKSLGMVRNVPEHRQTIEYTSQLFH